MTSGALTPLQLHILEALADLEPPWTLTGGGALVGFHLKHRTTRDLDLFLHGRATLEDYAARATERLRDAGMEVRSLQTGTSMHRLQASCGDESTVVDLVAEPVPAIEKPVERSVGRATIRVDTEHEILVNKLCALVQRSELRDLVDVRELLAHGGDLTRGLTDAPEKDTGFSPMTLAWLLKDVAIGEVGRSEGWSEDRIAELEGFRDSLLERLGDLSRPESGDSPKSAT
jgi:hypothetical protein